MEVSRRDFIDSDAELESTGMRVIDPEKPSRCPCDTVRCLAGSESACSSVAMVTHEPKSFLVNKAREHDVVLFGTRHNRPSTLETIIEMLPVLAESGITHMGLEIAADQQHRIDAYKGGGENLEEIEVFHAIDCVEYRCLIQAILMYDIVPVALDLPRSMWRGSFTRDQWMAKTICEVFENGSEAKVFAVVGNLHALKRVDWIDPERDEYFISGYLERYMPDLEVFSMVVEHTDCSDVESAFQGTFAGEAKPLVVETAGLDLRLGVQRLLAARAMGPHELADAVIVY